MTIYSVWRTHKFRQSTEMYCLCASKEIALKRIQMRKAQDDVEMEQRKAEYAKKVGIPDLVVDFPEVYSYEFKEENLITQ